MYNNKNVHIPYTYPFYYMFTQGQQQVYEQIVLLCDILLKMLEIFCINLNVFVAVFDL